MGGQRHAPFALHPGKWHIAHCVRIWVGFRAGLLGCVQCRPTPGFDPWIVQPVASRYTDYAISARLTVCTLSCFVSYILAHFIETAIWKSSHCFRSPCFKPCPIIQSVRHSTSLIFPRAARYPADNKGCGPLHADDLYRTEILRRCRFSCGLILRSFSYSEWLICRNLIFLNSTGCSKSRQTVVFSSLYSPSVVTFRNWPLTWLRATRLFLSAERLSSLEFHGCRWHR